MRRAMRAKLTKAQDCIVPGCSRPAELRGLCKACYVSAKRAVLLGRIDWPTLEKHRLILPSKYGCQKTAPMTLAIEAVAKATSRKKRKR